MGDNTTTTQTSPSTSIPQVVQFASPYVTDVMNTAKNLFGQNTGINEPTYLASRNQLYNQVSTFAPQSYLPFNNAVAGSQGSGAASPYFGTINSVASGNPGFNPLYQPGSTEYNLMGQGWNLLNNIGSQNPGFNPLYAPGSTEYNWMGQGANALNDAYQRSNQLTAADQYLSGMAAGTNPTNPFLSQLLDANAARIGNRAASLSSGAGRYGSAGMYDALNRSIAETNNPLLFQSAEAERNRQLQAAGLIGSQRLGNAQLAAQAGQGIANIGQGYGQLNNQARQLQLQAGQDLATAGQNYGMLNNQARQLQLQAAGMGNNNLQQWSQLTPSLYNEAVSPYTTMASVGQAMALDPWQNLFRYQQALSGLGPLWGGQASSGNMQTVSQPTPWTTYAGLGLAGLGALSDVRAKTDIEHLGTDPTGLNMYRYRYKGQPKNTDKFIGPMAQEVAQRNPERVGREPWTGLMYLKA